MILSKKRRMAKRYKSYRELLGDPPYKFSHDPNLRDIMDFFAYYEEVKSLDFDSKLSFYEWLQKGYKNDI